MRPVKTQTVYECEFCKITTTYENHEKICTLNPEYRHCKTCYHLEWINLYRDDDGNEQGEYYRCKKKQTSLHEYQSNCEDHLYFTIEQIHVKKTIETLLVLTKEERLKILANFCANCGSSKDECQCENGDQSIISPYKEEAEIIADKTLKNERVFAIVDYQGNLCISNYLKEDLAYITGISEIITIDQAIEYYKERHYKMFIPSENGPKDGLEIAIEKIIELRKM